MQAEDAPFVIAGATGVVGREAAIILAERGVPASRVTLLASSRSAGRELPYGTSALKVRHLQDHRWAPNSVALFCVDGETAQREIPRARAAGALVVDNSSTYRMDPEVPLVIPEVNGASVQSHHSLVANPNCSTILMVLALEPLRQRLGLEEVVVSTYQAASGAGAAALAELHEHTRAALDGEAPLPQVFPHTPAFNAFPHESPRDPITGWNEEEDKMRREAQRIWGSSAIAVWPTCIRIPVVRAHSQAIVVRTHSPTSEDQLRDFLREAPGLQLHAADDPPTPLVAAGGDAVHVGHVRLLAPDRVALWICGDQLRKGAALNAIQIALARAT